MSFHFCSQTWEVRDTPDGTLVKLTPRNLNQEALAVLVDELFDLVQESGQPNLSLDFTEIRAVTSVILGKMLALDAKLRQHGGRLILLNTDSFVYQKFDVTRLTKILDVRQTEATGFVA